jgi:hypothetical protein
MLVWLLSPYFSTKIRKKVGEKGFHPFFEGWNPLLLCQNFLYLIINVFGSKSKLLVEYGIWCRVSERFQTEYFTVGVNQTFKINRQTGCHSEFFNSGR